MTRPRPRRCRAVALGVVMVAALVLGLSAPASGHANLLRTDPVEGSVLRTAPDRVLFVFDEAVRAIPEGVQVFDPQGAVVETSSTVRGSELTVAVSKTLDRGTTVIVWRVVSEDGHPISGSLSFSVGAPTSDFTPPEASTTASTRVPWTLTLVRGLGYVGLFLATGLAVFAVLFVPVHERTERARQRLRKASWAAAFVVVPTWLIGLPLTAVYLLDVGAGALTRGSTWSSLPTTEYVVPVTVVVGVVLAVLLLGRGLPSRGRRAAVIAAAAAAAAAPALTGHTRAATPEGLTVVAGVLHLLAGSLWLGGVAGLALVLPQLARGGTLAAEILSRFSAVGAGILVALVACGTVLGWRILGSWGGLFDTAYGGLLLAKVGLAGFAVAIAAWNRWSLLPRLRQATRQGDRLARSRPVVRATAVEAVALVAVLLVTGVLVDESPEGDVAPARTEPATQRGAQRATLGDIEVRATITPRTPGANTVRLQLRSATGEPTEGVAPPVVRMFSDDVRLGAVPLTQVVAGTYTAQVVLPTPGTWRMQISLRVSEFANPVSEVEFVVGG